MPSALGTPYFRPSILGPACSTDRSARLRDRRFQLAYANLSEPPEYTQLANEAKLVYLEWEKVDPAIARAKALYHVVEHCPVTPEEGALLGGENPFLFNLLLPTLRADRYDRFAAQPVEPVAGQMRSGWLFQGPCFEGHISPALENILALGVKGVRQRISEMESSARAGGVLSVEKEYFYEAARISCDAASLYTRRYCEEAARLASQPGIGAWGNELNHAAEILLWVPENPARNFQEALHSYWILYILVTIEMGGCNPGGGLGLGRPDQYLFPYYQRDIQQGRLTRPQALELLELFLLCFRHNDYFTPHQVFTPGSQASLGGITPSGQDGFNELSELLLEASLRINMPAPYISLRLYKNAPDRYWEAAANYIASGLGFPVVNDEAIIPAFLKHGRSLADARDYICSCCYEHTIPGREAFHPSCVFVNLLLILELALNQGKTLNSQENLGLATPPPSRLDNFQAVLEAFQLQIHFVFKHLVDMTNRADAAHCQYRRYPLMSLFIDDCLANGRDVCAGGARYNLTGCVVGGLPNVVNSLAAIQKVVFQDKFCTLENLVNALRDNFQGHNLLQKRLMAVPKWGNGNPEVDQFAGTVAQMLYDELKGQRNPRGGRWQLGLYSFITNHWMGRASGASADGRMAGESLTRNLNPSWGTDLLGPTAVLESLSHIDFSLAPDGCSLDLRFNPADFGLPGERHRFIGFLKAFVELGVMEMQISVADTETLLDAQSHPEKYPHLLVRVAGYSARFIDLSKEEQAEIISRNMKSMA